MEKQFGELLGNIRIPTDVIGLVTQALRESHHDEKRCHEAVVAKLQAEHDTIYLNRLDGRIDADFFDRKAAAFRDDQTQILSEIHDHQTANQSYIEEGIKLLDLAGQAHELFENQPACEKRKLLDFVLSNCAWKEGILTTKYRQPFDLIADAGRMAARTAVDAGAITHQNENWLPGMDSNHELDRFLKSCNLFYRVTKVPKSLKRRIAVQNRYNISERSVLKSSR